jgi:hypothetical protein
MAARSLALFLEVMPSASSVLERHHGPESNLIN